MPKDDRDFLKKMVAPAGVRAQSASGEVATSFDEDTPIEGDSLTRIEQRGKTTAKNTKAAVELIVEVEARLQAQIRSYAEVSQREVRNYAETDQRDHREMKGTLAKQDLTLANQDRKLDEIGGHVSDLREGFGKVSGALEVMTEAFKTGQVVQRVEAETTAAVLKQKTTYKLKRNLIGWKMIGKIVGAVAAVVGSGIAGHLLVKWLAS